MTFKKTDRYDDESPQASEATPTPRTWCDWIITKRWRVYADKGFGMMPYDYAEPRVYVGSNRQGGPRGDAEHDAYTALASHLIGLRHTDDDADLDLVREDWSTGGDGRPSKNGHEWLTTVSVAGIAQEHPHWASLGSLALTEVLKQRSYPNIPNPRSDPRQRQVVERGVLEIQEALKKAIGAMHARRNVVAAPITPTEYAEAKAEGWDAFGDPGKPNPQPGDWLADACPRCNDPYCADRTHAEAR
jgi:hypothetical protein